MKSFIALIIAFGIVTPSFAAAQDYGFLGFGGGGDSFLFGNRPSAPRQELYVHSWGLTDPAPNYLQQQNQYASYYPQNTGYGYNSYGAQFANPYFSQYGSQYLGSNGYQNVMPQFVNHIAAPNTMSVPGMNASYGTPSYQNYSYPSYQQYSYSEPQYTSYGSYGYGYGAAPTGGKDFWGNPMCNWGADYGNFPCDRDPHQWVYDPYSGSWY